MSVNITINHALKKYGEKVIIPDLNMKIKEGGVFHAPWAVRLRKDDASVHDRRVQLDRGR